MASNSNREQAITLDLDRLVSHVRWLWLILAALFVTAENYLSVGPPPNFDQLLIVLGVGFVLNLLYVGLLWADFFPGWLAVISLVLDTAFAVALLTLLERHSQLLLPLMVYPVVVAGLRWNIEAGIVTALPIILTYARPLLPMLQAGDNLNPAEIIPELLTLGVNALTLLLAGSLPDLFIRQRIRIARHSDAAELEQLRIANKRGKLVSEMALTLSSTLDYRQVLRATIDSAFSALSEVAGDDESTVGVVLLFEGDDGQLTLAAGRNISRNMQGRQVNANSGFIGRTIEVAEATITHSAEKDKVLTSLAPRCRSAICAPLRAGLSTYGVLLFCSTKPKLYQKEHAILLATLCSQAIIALQNAQLFEDVQHEQQKILEKEAEARRKLARDLHDGPTQSVAAIAMRLNFIKMVIQNNEPDKAYSELVEVEDIAQKVTKEIRTMLFAMRPVILETQGLIPALNQYANRLNETENFRVSVIDRGYNGQLDEEAEGVVFAIVEEAVGNAKKHAEASEIRISVISQNGALKVEIKDNGVGFDVIKTQSTYDQRTSLGLINMNERAALVGGLCTLDSAPGQGTTVQVEIPYVRAVDPEHV